MTTLYELVIDCCMSKRKPQEIDVKAVRESLNETQLVFGARFGVDQTTVHKWEFYGLPNRGTTRAMFEQFLKTLADEKRAKKKAKIKDREFA